MKEKRMSRYWWYILLMLVGMVVGTSSKVVYAQEVSFTIPKQYIDAHIHEDGSVTFYDYQLYQADYMNGAEFTLDYKGYELADFQVGVADEVRGDVDYFDHDASRRRGTYEVRDLQGLYTSRAYYPLNNQSKYFVYQYTLKALVTNYLDTAVFVRKLGSNDFTTDVKVRIELPDKVTNKEDFRAWGAGAGQGQVSLNEEDGKSVVYLDVPQRKSDQFVEAQVIFPTSLTASNPNQVNANKKEAIIADGQARADKDRKKVQNDSYLGFGLITLSVLVGPLLAVGAMIKYFKDRQRLNPTPVFVPEYVYEIPEAISPAEMSVRHFKSVPDTNDFSATFLDLVQRGFFAIKAIESDKSGFLFANKEQDLEIRTLKSVVSDADLLEYEREVYDYFASEGEEVITFSQLKDKADLRPTFQESQYQHWQNFQDSLAGLGERYRGQTVLMQEGIVARLILGVIGSVVASIVSLFLIDNMISQRFVPVKPLLILLAGGFILTLIAVLITAIALKRQPLRTTQQEQDHDMWMGFKNMLRDIGNFKVREIASLPLWEKFMVYAMALGVADKVSKVLEMEFTPEELATYGGGYTDFNQSVILNQWINRNVADSIQSVTPQAKGSDSFSGSNGDGFGGGFSSGSFGGSGGGTHSGGF